MTMTDKDRSHILEEAGGLHPHDTVTTSTYPLIRHNMHQIKPTNKITCKKTVYLANTKTCTLQPIISEITHRGIIWQAVIKRTHNTQRKRMSNRRCCEKNY